MTRSNSKITESLIEFGLTDAEAEVYQAALALGARPASVIAQNVGLKRAHTYNVLRGLMEKGIVQEFEKRGIKHFTCSPPSSLISVLENRERELILQKQRLEQILPELKKLQNPLSAQPRVRFYQGFDGLREVYDDMLRTENSEILALVDLKYTWTAVGPDGLDYVVGFIKRREKRNIVWRGICVGSSESDAQVKMRPSHLRAMKLIEGISCPAEISVYGSRVAFTSTHNELIGIIVENEPIAETIRSVLEKMWQLLPDYKPA